MCPLTRQLDGRGQRWVWCLLACPCDYLHTKGRGIIKGVHAFWLRQCEQCEGLVLKSLGVSMPYVACCWARDHLSGEEICVRVQRERHV